MRKMSAQFKGCKRTVTIHPDKQWKFFPSFLLKLQLIEAKQLWEDHSLTFIVLMVTSVNHLRCWDQTQVSSMQGKQLTHCILSPETEQHKNNLINF